MVISIRGEAWGEDQVQSDEGAAGVLRVQAEYSGPILEGSGGVCRTASQTGQRGEAVCLSMLTQLFFLLSFLPPVWFHALVGCFSCFPSSFLCVILSVFYLRKVFNHLFLFLCLRARNSLDSCLKLGCSESEMVNPAGVVEVGRVNSSVVRAPDSWLKGCGFEPLQERWENFLLHGQLCMLTLMLVSIPPTCYGSSTLKTRVSLPKVQVAGYS